MYRIIVIINHEERETLKTDGMFFLGLYSRFALRIYFKNWFSCRTPFVINF